MNIGSLNRRVSIERPASAQGPDGAPVQTWESVAQVWANIRHLSGREVLKDDRDVSIVRASIRIRYRTGLDAGMRVVAGSTVYKVNAVLPDEVKREHVDLVCEIVT